MIQPITPNKLYLILPYKVSQLSVLYAKKFGVSTIDAMKAIYLSNTYKRLEDESTKLWHLGPVALLEYISEHN